MLPPHIGFIFKAARHAVSADNSQPWHFFWDGTSIKISYDLQRVKDTTFPAESPATLIAIGSVIEHMDQAANEIDCPITWTILEQAPLTYYAQGHVSQTNENMPMPLDSEKIALFNNLKLLIRNFFL